MLPPEPLPVTIVVPCYNEEAGLHRLARRLAALIEHCRDRYRFSVIIVDDASTDDTWARLQSFFGHEPHCGLVRLDRNRGISAALTHGASLADTEIICTMDSDCTYDPELFVDMIPLLRGDVCMVTASPYHRDGGTQHVSAGRLLLSRGLSLLYRLVSYQKLATYTCCFRVYRRSSLASIEVGHDGFAGIAELAVRLDHAGRRIAEQPAVLKARCYGVSKMRIVENVLAHLGLLARLGWERWAGPKRPRAGTAGNGPVSHAD